MKNELIGPIVIGGIGGSGTRVVAQILKELNVFIGNDLNEALDNLSFTLLFKRPEWFYKNTDNKKEIFTGLSILEKSMLKSFPTLTKLENNFLEKATDSMSKYGHNFTGDGKGEWAIERSNKVREGRPESDDLYYGWGWKEPNSHLLLPFLNKYFPNFKYIHTVRNGLDMAFSSNQQQLFNWGPMYGIDLPKNEEELPEASFRYWLAANKKVMNVESMMGRNRFYLLNFDKLCKNAECELAKLIKYLNIKTKDIPFDGLKKIPAIPISQDRYKNMNTKWLTNYINDYSLMQDFLK